MINCMKKFAYFGAILILLTSFVMIAITFFGYQHEEMFLGNTQARNIILIFLTGACATIVIAALIGICGVKKHHRCLLCIFQLFVIIMLFLFFAIGLATLILPNKFFEGDCQTSGNIVISGAFKAYGYSQAVLCVPDVCPCNMESDAFNKYSKEDQQILLTQYVVNDTKGATVSIQCIGYPPARHRFATLLGQIESFLQCSMWCQGQGDNLFYRYSSINNGKPTSYCYQQLFKKMNEYSIRIAVGSFIMSGVLLLVCIFNVKIYRHPKNKYQSVKNQSLLTTIMNLQVEEEYDDKN